MTTADLIAAIGTIPGCFRSNAQRISYMLSVLRSHQNAVIAKAAISLYDGSISAMSKKAATSTPEAVASAVLARCQ